MIRSARRGALALGISLAMAAGGWLAESSPGTALALFGHSYYVATTGSDAMSCQANSNLHLFQTITRAMTCVATDPTTIFGPDIVHIAAGTYPENVIITGNVNLLGAGRGTTIIDGGDAGSVITNPGWTVTINGVTMTNGNGSSCPILGFSCGGGIQNYPGAVTTVLNSAITNNTATQGGGINNLNATIALTNTLVSHNTASGPGGGIASSHVATLNNSQVTLNRAQGRGGIINVEGTLKLVNSPVSDRDAGGGQGSGIWNHAGATMTLLNSPLSGNSAATGGGIYNDGSTADLLNSPVSKNGSCGDGGGIWNGYNSQFGSSSMTLQNSAVTGNLSQFLLCFSSFNGGGIWTDGACGSTLTLKNESIAKNFAGGDSGRLYDTGASEPDETCTGEVGVTLSHTVIGQNTVDNC